LFDLKPLEIARQLTLIEFDLYRKIQPKECLNQAWNKTDREINAPNISAMIRRFNEVSLWIATEVLSYSNNIKMRTKMIELFIKVAGRLRDLNNYNGIIEVLAGLQCVPVFRLKKTWAEVDKDLLNLFEELDKVVSCEHNYKNIREELRKRDPPCIPFLGVFLTDLTFIDEGNPSTINDGLINFDKQRKFAQILQNIQKFQNSPYNLQTVELIQNYILNREYLAENELYKLSLVAEARVSQ